MLNSLAEEAVGEKGVHPFAVEEGEKAKLQVGEEEELEDARGKEVGMVNAEDTGKKLPKTEEEETGEELEKKAGKETSPGQEEDVKEEEKSSEYAVASSKVTKDTQQISRLSLEYEAGWLVQRVITRDCMKEYNTIFRLLLTERRY